MCITVVSPWRPQFLHDNHSYLYDSSLVHGTHDEEGVWRPDELLDLVEAGVEVDYLQCLGVPHHQPVLAAAGQEFAVGGKLHLVLR